MEKRKELNDGELNKVVGGTGGVGEPKDIAKAICPNCKKVGGIWYEPGIHEYFCEYCGYWVCFSSLEYQD